MHTKNPKKHTPAKAAAIRLTLLLFSMCTKPHRPLPKFRATNQRNSSRALAKPARHLHGHANANLNDYHYLFL